MDLSQIEAGRIALTEAAFDLRLIAGDVTRLGASKAEAKAVDVVLRYSPRLPRRAMGHAALRPPDPAATAG
jgi:signal transduction histidine kinase